MESEEITDSSTSSAFRQFAASTTAHGFGKLNHPIKLFRVTWTILILAATCVCGLHLSQMVQKLMNEEVSVSIDPQGAPLVPPDVTFCTKNYFPISKMFQYEGQISGENFTISRNAQANMTAKLVDEIKRLGYSVTDKLYNGTNGRAAKLTQSKLIRYMNVKYNNYGSLMLATKGPSFFKNISAATTNMILYCSHGSLGCERTSLIPVTVAGKPNCFTFNLASHAKAFEKTNSTYVDGRGELKLIVFLDYFFPGGTIMDDLLFAVDENLGTMSYPSISVFIHKPGTFPTYGTEINAAGSVETTITVKHSQFEFVNRRAKPCNPNTNDQIEYDVTHSITHDEINNKKYLKTREDCLNEMTQRELLLQCSCLSPQLPIPSSLRHELKCGNVSAQTAIDNPAVSQNPPGLKLFRAIEKNNLSDGVFGEIFKQFQCIQVASSNLNIEKLESSCPQYCSQDHYETSVSSVPWPSLSRSSIKVMLWRWLTFSKVFGNGATDKDEILTNIKNKIWTLARIFSQIDTIDKSALSNFAYVRVKMQHSTYNSSSFQEKIDYLTLDFICDFGGMLGLYLGVSLLTVCEVFELLLNLGLLVKLQTGRKVKDEKWAESVRKN